MNNGKGMVFNVQRFCLHDGPGIRTVLFLKGCPLACAWCSNPESQQFGEQLMYNRTLCRACGLCLKACPHGALSEAGGGVGIARERCRACGTCAATCPWAALRLSGKAMSVDEVMDVVCKDITFYALSGGGVTFSGGEPGVQSDFVLEVMKRCRALGIPTALETSGQVDPEALRRMADFCERILFDIKHTDMEQHRRFTGVDNERILENLRVVAGLTAVIVRVPLIPEVNMNEAFYEQLGSLLNDIPIRQVEFLPYHRLGSGKYDQLGRSYTCPDLMPEDADIAAAVRALQSRVSVPVTAAD